MGKTEHIQKTDNVYIVITVKPLSEGLKIKEVFETFENAKEYALSLPTYYDEWKFHPSNDPEIKCWIDGPNAVAIHRKQLLKAAKIKKNTKTVVPYR